MRSFVCAAVLSLAGIVCASAQAPDSENGRYTFNAVPDGLLRLDTRTGHVSHCSRLDAGWTCKSVPDERAALEREIAQLREENTALKLAARGQPDGPRKPGELGLPSDADVDKVMSFMEKVWRRLIEMATTVQRDVEKRN